MYFWNDEGNGRGEFGVEWAVFKYSYLSFNDSRIGTLNSVFMVRNFDGICVCL